jgi:23S rRNA (uridine2552-2'-O)-methyltransferase
MSSFNLHDHYFNKAKAEGFVARSVYKLEEIDQSIKVIKADSLVLDLGCAPGSWLQYVAKKLKKNGRALGVDLQEVKNNFGDNIKTVVDDCFLLTDEKISGYMSELTPDFKAFDVILSDMAPKTSGIKHVDQTRSFDLAEKVLAVSNKWLKPQGSIIIKVFASHEINQLISEMKKSFQTVRQMRPKSIRSVSKEFYVVGLKKI